MPPAGKLKRAEPLEIVAPSKSVHREELFDMLAKVYSWRGGYYERLEMCRNGYIDDSHYDWSASRIGLLGGKIVTHWGVWDYRMRIGATRVRVAGVGWVATDGRLRKRGLTARTARAWLQAVPGHGYDMTVLFGIPNLYHRFGYVRAWSEGIWTVAAGDLPKQRPPARLHEFSLARRREDTDALYNRQYARVTGTAVRPPFQSHKRPKCRGYLWCDSRGRTAGYVILDLGNMQKVTVTEAVGPAKEVLAAVGVLARRLRLIEIRFRGLAADGDLARCLRWGNSRCEIHYARSSGAMVRTVNLRSCLVKLAPELSRRLRRSHLAAWRGTLLVADPREKVVLAIARGRVRVADGRSAPHAIIGGEEIAQLLLGTDDPAEVIRAGGMKTRGDAAELAAVLFPNQHPMLCEWDRF